MDEQIKLILDRLDEEIKRIIVFLQKDFQLVRTGRANPAILDKIMVSYYGVPTPLSQVATIQIVEGTQLYIKPFDRSIIKEIEQKINESDLNLPPINDGNGVRLILPKLTEERRKESAKEVEKKAENAKIPVRNERRKANDDIRLLELPEDLEKKTLDDIQNVIDKAIVKIDELAKEKIAEVLKI